MGLSPAELQALQAAQLASNVDGPAAPPLPTPSAGGSQVQPYTVTNESLGPTVTSGGSSSKISARGEQALSAADEATDAKIAAMRGPTLAHSPDSDTDEAQSSFQARQLEANGLKPVPAGQPGANMPFSSKQFNASPQANAPRTLEAAMDEKAKYEADYNARVAAETQKKQAELARNAAEEQQAAQARINAAAEDKKKAGNITSFWENRSTPQKILGVLGMAFGAASSAYTHGPNYAMEIIHSAINQDFQIKKAKLDNAVEEMRLAGAAPAQIREKQKFLTEQLLASQKAQLDTLQAKANQMLAPFPQAQQKADLAIASVKAEQEQKKADLIVAHTGTTSESHRTQAATTVQTVEGKDQGGGQGRVTPDSVDQLVRARQNAKNINSIQERDLPTGDEWNEILRNEHAVIAQNSSEVAGGLKNVKAGDFMRWIGAMPTSIYPDSMSDEKKEAARVILEQAHALFAKRWTPGSISQPEAYAHGMAPLLPQPGDKPAAISHKFGELKDYANGLAKEMEQVLPAAVAEHKGNAKAAAPVTVTTAQLAKDTAAAKQILSDKAASPAQKAAANKFLDQLGKHR